MLIIVYFIIEESNQKLQEEDIITMNPEYTTDKQSKKMVSHIHVKIYIQAKKLLKIISLL